MDKRANPTSQDLRWADGSGKLMVTVSYDSVLWTGDGVRKDVSPGDEVEYPTIQFDMPLDEAEDFAAKLLGAVRQERETQRREAKEGES